MYPSVLPWIDRPAQETSNFLLTFFVFKASEVLEGSKLESLIPFNLPVEFFRFRGLLVYGGGVLVDSRWVGWSRPTSVSHLA